jgi:hypothetical protein
MSRLTSRLVLAASLLGAQAYAQSQAEIAERLNEEGKELMFAGRYAEASAKFQDAHGRVPEPKYFFNHCTSLYQEGKFGAALTSCNAADKNADPNLKGKIAKMVERIQAEAKEQGIDLQPVGGGAGPGETPPVDPNQPPPDPNQPHHAQPYPHQPYPQPNYAVGRPPTQGLFAAAPPENKYTWSLGFDLFGGGGRIGQEGAFGGSTGGFRFKGDYLVNPAQRFGTQMYLQWTRYGENDTSVFNPQTLDIIDLGVAAYKHLCGPRSRMCLTPLAGVQLAMMSPNNQTSSTGEQVFNYAALGARLEIGLHYALGRRYEHVLGAFAGMNLYTSVFSEPADGYSAMAWGLDRGGGSGYFGFGYTYRFNTPFGHAPFVTLE